MLSCLNPLVTQHVHKTSYEGEAVVLLMMMLYFLGVVASFGVLIAEELENLIGHISKKEWLLASLKPDCLPLPRPSRKPFTLSQEWLLAFAPIMILMSQLPNVTAVAKMTPLAVFCILILVSVTYWWLWKTGGVEEGL